jgi:hypothetical protein
MSNIPNKKWYDVSLTNKIRDSVESAKKIPLDLDENIKKMKSSYDKYSRKDINLNFLDRFSRKLYANPSYLGKLEVIQYIIFLVLIYYYNPLNINTKYPAFTNLLVLCVSFTYILLFIFLKNKIDKNDDVDLIDPSESNILIKFISLIIFFALFMVFIKGLLWVFMNTSIIRVINHMVGLLIFVVILGIVYLYFRKTINKAKNAPGRKLTTLFLKFIMYLPCLIVDVTEYVKYELNLTTKPVWILLGVEGSLIALYFIIPLLFDKMMTANGLKLLNQPTYLSQENTLANYKQLHKKKLTDTENKNMDMDEVYKKKINKNAEYAPDEIDYSRDADSIKPKGYTDPNIPKNVYLAWIYEKLQKPTWISFKRKVVPQYTDKDAKQFRYAYALSAWFYINPQPPNTRTAYTKYTNIIKYGNNVNVEFNGQLSSIRVMANVATSGDDVAKQPNDSIEIYETKNVLYQKWNNVVINYDDGYLDIFMNGELVGSRSGVAPYMTKDSIVAGAEMGILGGICNVTYYDTTLSKSNIELSYKSLSGKQNPYVWRLKDDIKINVKRDKKKNIMDEFKHTFGIK